MPIEYMPKPNNKIDLSDEEDDDDEEDDNVR